MSFYYMTEDQIEKHILINLGLVLSLNYADLKRNLEYLELSRSEVCKRSKCVLFVVFIAKGHYFLWRQLVDLSVVFTQEFYFFLNVFSYTSLFRYIFI